MLNNLLKYLSSLASMNHGDCVLTVEQCIIPEDFSMEDN